MALFSMLFGMGLCIQMDRSRCQGASFGGFAARRLLALALLGVAHGTLIWTGDVLVAYALTGILLAGLLQVQLRSLVLLTLGGLVLLAFPQALYRWLHLPRSLELGQWMQQGTWLLQEGTRAYGHGSWVEAWRWRMWEWKHLGAAICATSL